MNLLQSNRLLQSNSLLHADSLLYANKSIISVLVSVGFLPWGKFL